MFCTSCGEKQNPLDKFCPSCGAHLNLGARQGINSQPQISSSSHSAVNSKDQGSGGESNKLSRVALTLGILSAFFFEFVLLPIVAVVISSLALVRASELAQKLTPKTGKGISIAGLILGSVYSLIGFYYLVAFR